MNPFYFGTSQNPLFGVYHPPLARDERGSGVVLCYPFGHEYLRAHRVFRQMAVLLSKAGFHVLRFDYSGTGDSAGDSEQGNLDRWLEDLSLAVDELKDMAAVQKISLVGLRLGGSLAARLATERGDLQALVLWNPIVSGGTYVQGLIEIVARGGDGVRLTDLSNSSTIGVRGFPLTSGMRAGLEGIDLCALAQLRVPTTFLITSGQHDQCAQLLEHLDGLVTETTHLHVADTAGWSEVDEDVTALIPQSVLQAIVDCLVRAVDV